jgi:hypothetical protein
MMSMHLLALAGDVVLAPGDATSFKHPSLTELIFPVSSPFDLNCVYAP